MTQVIDLKNIGKTLAQRLAEIHVFTRQDLKKTGSAEAHRRIQKNYPDKNLPVCYYLYSLEGALNNKDWRSFSEQQKANMRKKAGL